MNKPVFMCIGVQKGATTSIDQIFLPSVKEVHYFDRDEKRHFIDALKCELDKINNKEDYPLPEHYIARVFMINKLLVV